MPASARCSRLSTTSSSSRADSQVASVDSIGSSGASAMPSDRAIAGRTSSGSRSAATSTNAQPSAKSPPDACANASASRVLPLPAAPASVTSLASGRRTRVRSSARSSSLSTSGVVGVGSCGRESLVTCGRSQRRVLPQDRALELAQLDTRLEPELAAQDSARVAVDIEGVGLPAATVEREHQMPPQTLAQGVLVDQRRQLGGHIIVAPEREIGADPLLEADQPKLLQAAGLGRGEARRRRRPRARALARVRARDEATKRPAERSPATVAARPLCEQPLEPRRIELVGSTGGLGSRVGCVSIAASPSSPP